MTKKKTKPIQPAFNVEYIDPTELLANPLNHRQHSQRQRKAYRAFRERLSDAHKWLIPVIFNSRTQRLVDGHLRCEEAIADEEDSIPVHVIDCDPSEEAFILEYFDAIGGLASINQEAHASLHELAKAKVGAVKEKNAKALAQLTKDMKGAGKLPLIKRSGSVSMKKPKVEVVEESETFIPEEQDTEVERSYINNEVKFESSNEFDLPDLLSESIATPEMLPRITFDRSYDSLRYDSYFCESLRSFPDKPKTGELFGTLGFFTEDWRFERAYDDGDLYAELLRSEHWRSVLTPDYSTYTSWPFPLQIFNVYRSRWCGRLWQELGIPVVPTIQYMGRRTNAVVIDTLPSYCPTLAIQTRKYTGTKSRNYSEFIDVVNYAHGKVGFDALLIYGNPSVAKYTLGFLPKQPEYIWLEEFNTARRKKKKK